MDLTKPHVLTKALQRVLREFSQDAHNIFTPLELCGEVVDKIPSLEGKVLVVANLEFLYTMHWRGVQAENLYFATPCRTKKRFALTLLSEENVFMYNNVITTEDVGGMKFDVVVGNPPYQDTKDAIGRKTSSIPLWFHFTRQAFNLAKPGGYVAFVTPSSWLVPTSKINSAITSHCLIDVKVFQKSPFKTAMTTTSTWIARNEDAPPDANIPITVGDTQYVVTPKQFLPSKPEHFAVTMSVLAKTVNAPLERFSVVIDSRNHTQNKKHRLKSQQTDEFQWPVVHTNTKTLWTNRPDDLHGVPKVIASKTGSINKARVDVESSIGEIAVAITTQSKGQAARLLMVLKGKFYRFLLDAFRHSSTIPSSYWKALPAVDLSRAWTDEELYKHFKLTKEEIDLIEATIK